jgi:predicted HicB family RNase H-like nuclease
MTDQPKRRGRPPRAEASATVLVTVRLTPEERAAYAAAAETMGTTLAEEARKAWARLVRRADRRKP